MNLQSSAILFLLGILFVLPSPGNAQSTKPDDTRQFRIDISSSMNGFSDETMLYFEAGVPAHDQFDVVKPPFSTNGAPQLATVSVDGAPLIMNSYGTITQQVSIPLKVKAGVTGIHKMRFFDGEGYMGATCIRLEDTNDGSISRIQEGDSIEFMLDVNTPADPPRFNLLIGTSNAYSHQNVSCFGLQDGQIAIIGGDTGPWNYDWYGPGDVFIQSHPNHSGVSKLNNAGPGVYRVDISGTNTCGVQPSFVEITEPDLIQAQFDIVDEHCALLSDGSIEVAPTGGIAPFSFWWASGETSSYIDGLQAGLYAVNVTDNSGCSRYYQNIEVGLAGIPFASIGVSADVAMVNEPVRFENGNHSGDEYLWDFGDGTISTLEDPTHAFAEPGLYTVSLILEKQGCSDTDQVVINVGANGINDIGPFKDVQLTYSNGYIMITGHDYTFERAQISVMDASGRLVLAPQSIGQNRQIPLTAGSSGVYRVVLSNPAGRKALPLTIIH